MPEGFGALPPANLQVAAPRRPDGLRARRVVEMAPPSRRSEGGHANAGDEVPGAAREEGEGGVGEGSPGKPGNDRYPYKAPARPPKRVRRVLSRANPEVIRKLEELKEVERRLFPEAALERERREAMEEERASAQAAAASRKQGPLSRKAKRELKKYGFVASGTAKSYSSRKLLSFRMLFAETQVEDSTDSEVAANMRLLFLAHADHNMPTAPDKFVAYLRNSLCSGISGAQLERLMDILVRYGYVSVSEDKVIVTVE